jgi:small subunit ribosomal protein S18
MAREPVDNDNQNENNKSDDNSKKESSEQSRVYRPRSRPSSQRFSRGGFRGGGRRGRYQPRRRVCLYCADSDKKIDWKKVDELRRFISDSGGIFPRRKTGLCARHQRRVAVAVKRARHIALLPFTSEHIRITGQK